MQGSPRIDELRQKFHENPRRYFAPLANEYRKAGDPEQAIAICRAHLAQQPGHMSGHVVYAQSLYDAGRTDESRVVFEKALSLDPDNAIVLRYLGDISRQRGDSSEALHWYSRALEADPQDSQVAAYVAELTEPLTEPAEAHADTHADEGLVAPDETPATVEPSVEKTEEPAAATHAGVESDNEPIEVASGSDAEVEMPEPSTEPEVVAAAESPFVTRTMAELYASQGHRDAALDVYRQLAAASPEDAEIASRIDELSSSQQQPEGAIAPSDEPPSEPANEASPEATSHEHEEPSPHVHQIPEMSPVDFADLAPLENATANEFTELTDFESDLTFHSETEAEPERVADDEPVESSAAHFTETEIGETHKWDDDVWGSDLPTGEMEIAPYDFAQPDLPADERSSTEAPREEAGAVEPTIEQPAAAEAPVAEDAAVAEEAAVAVQPVTASEPQANEFDKSAEALEFAERGSASVPLGVLNDAHEDLAPEELAVSTHGASMTDDLMPDQHEDESLVAYSPQTPDEDELRHYEPQGPTIREFFATLGARRPPVNGAESFTAHAAVPGVDAIDDLPLASDAFSSLFADSPVSEEDSKAAFALSGAMGAHAPAPEVSRPRATPQAAAPAVSPPAPAIASQQGLPAAAQESEEDIRRFREWLDGLADA